MLPSVSYHPEDDDYELPVDQKSCSLLGRTALVSSQPLSNAQQLTLSKIVQALMGVFVIASLLLKRHREKPKRPWKIWYLSGLPGMPHVTNTIRV